MQKQIGFIWGLCGTHPFMLRHPLSLAFDGILAWWLCGYLCHFYVIQIAFFFSLDLKSAKLQVITSNLVSNKTKTKMILWSNFLMTHLIKPYLFCVSLSFFLQNLFPLIWKLVSKRINSSSDDVTSFLLSSLTLRSNKPECLSLPKLSQPTQIFAITARSLGYSGQLQPYLQAFNKAK